MRSKRKTLDAKRPDHVDKHVGAQMRTRREALGMSQSELGNALGVTFQQVQKYEKGANRISAGRLQQASRMLDAPLSYFYEGLVGELSSGFAEAAAVPYVAPDEALLEEGRRLIRAFQSIADPARRRVVIELVEGMADDLAASANRVNVPGRTS